MASSTKTLPRPALFVAFISVCGFSLAITRKVGISITVTSRHDSESLIPLREGEHICDRVDQIFTQEEQK
jgi:hypothetical protein